MAERCLYYQMELFGNQIDNLHNKESQPIGQFRNVNLLDLLSPEFTKEELMNLRQAHGQPAPSSMVISRWKKEGLIVKVGNNLWRKCV